MPSTIATLADASRYLIGVHNAPDLPDDLSEALFRATEGSADYLAMVPALTVSDLERKAAVLANKGADSMRDGLSVCSSGQYVSPAELEHLRTNTPGRRSKQSLVSTSRGALQTGVPFQSRFTHGHEKLGRPAIASLVIAATALATSAES